MLMMAFANYDPPGVQHKATIIAETFNKRSGVSEDKMTKLATEVAHHPDFEDRMKMTLRDGELRIVFTGSAVFPEGSFQLDQPTISMVDTLIEMIKSKGTDFRILVEGHADKNESLLASNMNHWSLSAARSASVAARFEYYGFKSEYMAAVAKGDREPVSEYKESLKNGPPPREISILNRRVVIRVLEPVGKSSKVRVGVLFRDAEGADAPSDTGIFRAEDSQ
jgi:flagellar motor protein MotB